MAKAPKTNAKNLAKLPRLANFVLQGNHRVIDIEIPDETNPQNLIKPVAALWMDSDGMVRSANLTTSDLTPDNGVTEAAQSLVTALAGPFSNPEIKPGLPEKVQVGNEKLAVAVRKILEPLSVPVEVVDELPYIEAAFDGLVAQTKSLVEKNAELTKPFEWDISAEMIGPLYRAADTFTKLAPWQYMTDDPIAIYLGDNGPQPEVKTIYAAVIGAAGMLYGLSFYNSLSEFFAVANSGFEQEEKRLAELDDIDIEAERIRLQQLGIPVKQMSDEELLDMVSHLQMITDEPEEETGNNLALWLEPWDNVDQTYLDWLQSHKLKYTKRQLIPEFKQIISLKDWEQPNEREIKALLISIEGLNKFFQKNLSYLKQGLYPAGGLELETETSVGGTVKVKFPAPNYDYEHFAELAKQEASKNKGKKFNIYQLVYDHNTDFLLEDEAEKYKEELIELYHKSAEWKSLLAEGGEVSDWPEVMLELGIQYEGVTPAQMAPAQLRDLLLEVFPRKVMVGPDEADEIVHELLHFWTFLQEDFNLPNAEGCLKILNDHLVELLEEELSDSEGFGPAKNLLMEALNNGVDLENRDEVMAWLSNMNNQLPAPSNLPPGLSSLPSPRAQKPKAAPKRTGRGKPPGSNKKKR